MPNTDRAHAQRTDLGKAVLILAAACSMLSSVELHAQDWGGSIGYSSDNLYRGLSLTADRPAWLADLHYEIGADWVVGAGASQVRPRHDTTGSQVALTLDRRWQFDQDWSARIGLAHYDWPGSMWRNELNYDEINAAIGYRGRWTLSVALSPNSTGIYSLEHSSTGLASWFELGLHQPIVGRLGVDLGVGYADRRSIGDYNYRYASAGLNYGFGDVHVFLSGLWTSKVASDYWWDAPGQTAHAHTRWVASFIWGF